MTSPGAEAAPQIHWVQVRNNEKYELPSLVALSYLLTASVSVMSQNIP
jgi:hypothetical protein